MIWHWRVEREVDRSDHHLGERYRGGSGHYRETVGQSRDGGACLSLSGMERVAVRYSLSRMKSQKSGGYGIEVVVRCAMQEREKE